MFYAFFVNQFF